MPHINWKEENTDTWGRLFFIKVVFSSFFLYVIFVNLLRRRYRSDKNELNDLHFELMSGSSAYSGSESEFEYEWKCIFPESAGQKATRQKEFSDGISKVVESGILSRESALQELKDYGCISKEATVGTDPNLNKGTSNDK